MLFAILFFSIPLTLSHEILGKLYINGNVFCANTAHTHTFRARSGAQHA